MAACARAAQHARHRLTARIRGYAAAGDLPADGPGAVGGSVADAPLSFGHGDPLASNALVAAGEPLIFIGFEFADMYPLGADLALLGLWLGRHDPGAHRSGCPAWPTRRPSSGFVTRQGQSISSSRLPVSARRDRGENEVL